MKCVHSNKVRKTELVRHVCVAASYLRVKTITMAFLHRQSAVETTKVLSLVGADASPMLCNCERVQ